MAHYARIDNNNLVINVVTFNETDNEVLANQLLQQIHGPSVWLRTSYNDKIRKNYAGIGYTYDPSLDAFIPPKPPFPSWYLDTTICNWVAPVPYPNDGNDYLWDEQTLSWVTY